MSQEDDLVPPEAPSGQSSEPGLKKEKKGLFSFLNKKSKNKQSDKYSKGDEAPENINKDMEKLKNVIAEEEEKDINEQEIPEFSDFSAHETEEPKTDDDSLIVYKEENYSKAKKETGNETLPKPENHEESDSDIPIPQNNNDNYKPGAKKKNLKKKEKVILKNRDLPKIPPSIKETQKLPDKIQEKESKEVKKAKLEAVKEKQKIIREKIPDDRFNTKIEKEAIAHFKKLEQDHKIAADQLRQAINDAKKLEEIKPENYFYLRTGTPVRSLKELAEVLKFMSDQDFKYHVNDKKNDFANWIRDILKKRSLAEKIRDTIVKKELLETLEEHESKVSLDINKYKKTIEDIEKKRQTEINNMIEQKIELGKLKEKIDKKNSTILELEQELKTKEAELNKREIEISNKESSLEKVYKSKTSEQLNKLTKMQDLLVQDKEKLEKVKKEFESKSQAAKAQIDNVEKEKKKIETKTKELNEREKKLNNKEQELNKKESLLEKREQAIKEQIDNEEKIRKELEYTQQKIESEKGHLESSEFKKYIEEELKSTDSMSLDEISNISGDLTPRPRTDNEIINLVNDCRKLVQRGELTEAQKMYNEIREKFLNLNLEKEEKAEIYNMLRELYDDIKLELINK